MAHIILHARAKILDMNGIPEEPEELELVQVPDGFTYRLRASGSLFTDIFGHGEEIVALWDSPLKASLGLLDLFGSTVTDLEVEIAPGIWSLPLSANLRWSRQGVAPAEFCGQPSLLKIRAEIEAELKAVHIDDLFEEVAHMAHPRDMIEFSVSRHKGGDLMQLRLEMFFDLAYRCGSGMRPEHRLEHLREMLEEAVGLLSAEQVEKLMSCDLVQRHMGQYFG